MFGNKTLDFKCIGYYPIKFYRSPKKIKGSKDLYLLVYYKENNLHDITKGIFKYKRDGKMVY